MAEYKIKDLENLTGIKSHTIRIWEKRYSILSPDRTDTKIRTYSDDELTHLLTVSMLNRNGIKISKIAQLEPSRPARPDIEHCIQSIVAVLISPTILTF